MAALSEKAMLTEAEKQAQSKANDLLRKYSRRPPPSEPGLLLDLTGDNERAYSELVDLLARSFGKNRGISRHAIGDALRKAFVLANGARPETRSIDAKERLAKSKQNLEAVLVALPAIWRIHEPIEEFVVQRRKQVGRVTFERMPEMSRRTCARLTGRSDVDVERAKQSLAEFTKARTLATVDVLAIDRGAAEELAHQAIEDAIALAHVFNHRFSETTLRDRKMLIRNTRDGNLSVADVGEVGRSHLEAAVEEASPKVWRAANSLLATPTPSEMEQRLIRGLRWSRRAGATRDPHAAVLQYVIGLETMLTKANRQGSSVELAYRGGWLFAPATVRERVARQIMGLYGERNNIAHGGPTELFRTPRFEARALFRDTLARFVLRSDLRAMTSQQFDEYWELYRFK